MDSRLKQHALGFWEIINKPTPDELQQYYAEKYYQEAKGSYELAYTTDELHYFQAKLAQRWHVIQDCQSLSYGSMLDVGCGEGYALAYFREKGWQVKGIDFSSAGVESKNPECSDVLATGDIFALLKAEIESEKTYDVVWLQNVLEHVLEPMDLLESIHQLIGPNGIAVVTVPNDCSVVQQAALKYQHIDKNFWVAPPDHLSYFDYVSLQNIAQATGWQCARVMADFPIEWLLFHDGSNYVRDTSVGKRAHYARVQLENLIHNQSVSQAVELWTALANVGMGRNLTAFLQAKS